MPLAQGVSLVHPANPAGFSVSPRVLIYGGGFAAQQESVWFDRSGKRLGTVGPSGMFMRPHLSPDGSRLAVDMLNAQTAALCSRGPARAAAACFRSSQPAPGRQRSCCRGIEAGAPQRVLEPCGLALSPPEVARYEVSADGRFLVLCAAPDQGAAGTNVVLDWQMLKP